jgi:hypothetical protein
MTDPHEWQEIRRKNEKATVARIFPIISIKGFETDQPKFKGRIVLQGSNIVGTDSDTAVFDEVASTPTSLNTIRAAVTYAALTENGECLQADAESAYTQHELTPEDGPDTYIRIPRAWLKGPAVAMRDPVFRLKRALYGHPRAGRIWEVHFQRVMSELGWAPIPAYPNSWTKRSPRTPGSKEAPLAFCKVHVDDIIMSGSNLGPLFDEMKKKVKMSDPAPVSKILGCDFHLERKGTTTTITQSMKGFVEQSIQQYLETPGAKPLKAFETPLVEESNPDDTPGVMAPHAASLLMKAFYAARCCRPDVMFAISYLARFITKWTAEHDKQLNRFFSYLNVTKGHVMTSVVDSNDREKVCVSAYADADHSGCKQTGRSTSGGGWNLLVSGKTESSLEWASKRQSATARSTTEAELISLSKLLRESAVPWQILWSVLLEREVGLKVWEDNEATITVVR